MTDDAATLGLQVAGPTRIRYWSLDAELPSVSHWRPVRIPRSNAHGRHVPVRAYSLTMAGHLSVESGLEHDLVRKLDRDPDVDLLLPQPCRLRFPDETEHLPDLLSRNEHGHLTLWDVRSPRRMDDAFHAAADKTRSACRALGWSYETFGGLEDVARLNLLWLNGYRHVRPWVEAETPRLLRAVAAGPQPLSALVALDRGDGHLTATLWHLLWSGRLTTKLDERIDSSSLVGVGRE